MLFDKLPQIAIEDLDKAKEQFAAEMKKAIADANYNPIAALLDDMRHVGNNGLRECMMALYSLFSDKVGERKAADMSDMIVILLLTLNNAAVRLANKAKQAEYDATADKLLEQLD